jgi:hypothetical protein
MEHRHSPRKSLHIDVVIRACDGAQIVGRTSNVSNIGMRVNMPHGVAIPRNSIVTVELSDSDRTLSALVLQADQHGMGLMFISRDDEVQHALNTLARG